MKSRQGICFFVVGYKDVPILPSFNVYDREDYSARLRYVNPCFTAIRSQVHGICNKVNNISEVNSALGIFNKYKCNTYP